MSLVSDITSQILAAGQARARGQRDSGAIWGQTLANIGQTIGQLPAQIQQSKIAEQDQKIKAQEMSIRQSQADALTRAQKISEQADGIVSNLMTQQPDGSFTPDRAKLTAAFTESKIPIEQQSKWFRHFDDIDESNSKFAKQRSESIADTANSAIKSIKDGADPDSAVAFAIGITKANHPNVTMEQFKPIIDAIAAGQDPVMVLTSARDSLSSKYKDAEKPDLQALPANTSGILDKRTGKVTPTGLPPQINNETELRLAAADPAHPLHAQAVEAMKLRPESVGSLAQQANEAQKRGDTAEYKRLLNVIKETGRADDKPSQVIHLASGMTPSQEMTQVSKLRGEFNRETKAAQTVNQQLALMRSSLDAVKKGQMTAGSQGVLVTFQKILDPTSVVRESEYARSASGLSLLGRIEGAWTKMAQGGAGVTAKDLEQFVNLSEQFARNQQTFAKQTADQIKRTADKYGLDSDLIVRDIAAPLNAPTAPTGKWMKDPATGLIIANPNYKK